MTATTKKKAAASSVFEAEAIYNIRVSAIHDSAQFKRRFSPAHPYKVKGKVAQEISDAGKLKSSELHKAVADLATNDD